MLTLFLVAECQPLKRFEFFCLWNADRLGQLWKRVLKLRQPAASITPLLVESACWVAVLPEALLSAAALKELQAEFARPEVQQKSKAGRTGGERSAAAAALEGGGLLHYALSLSHTQGQRDAHPSPALAWEQVLEPLRTIVHVQNGCRQRRVAALCLNLLSSDNLLLVPPTTAPSGSHSGQRAILRARRRARVKWTKPNPAGPEHPCFSRCLCFHFCSHCAEYHRQEGQQPQEKNSEDTTKRIRSSAMVKVRMTFCAQETILSHRFCPECFSQVQKVLNCCAAVCTEIVPHNRLCQLASTLWQRASSPNCE